MGFERNYPIRILSKQFIWFLVYLFIILKPNIAVSQLLLFFTVLVLNIGICLSLYLIVILFTYLTNIGLLIINYCLILFFFIY